MGWTHGGGQSSLRGLALTVGCELLLAYCLGLRIAAPLNHEESKELEPVLMTL
jgi:hypothetical protein